MASVLVLLNNRHTLLQHDRGFFILVGLWFKLVVLKLNCTKCACRTYSNLTTFELVALPRQRVFTARQMFYKKVGNEDRHVPPSQLDFFFFI